MLSFKDIFKKSFLQGFSSTELTLTTIAVALLVACALAFYIFLVYRVLTRKTFYSQNFNISLAGITVITAALILTMQSSIVLSLGMVGALSIVRFRTAIKDPMDLMFLFWAISAGIVCGAGLAMIAVILSVLLTVGIVVLNQFPVMKAPMLLIVNADDIHISDAIQKEISAFTKYYKIKSRNMTATTLDFTVELRTANGDQLVEKLMNIKGVTSVSLLSHDGETVF